MEVEGPVCVYPRALHGMGPWLERVAEILRGNCEVLSDIGGLAGMLMAARNLPAALRFVSALDPAAPDMERTVENGKKAFAGFELAGHTLGVIGLGRIGCLVADAAIRLGMHVVGYDPEITVDAAWSLPSQVHKAH